MVFLQASVSFFMRVGLGLKFMHDFYSGLDDAFEFFCLFGSEWFFLAHGLRAIFVLNGRGFTLRGSRDGRASKK
jgi:hypothetical protein